MSVITAFKFDYFISSCKAAGSPYGRHGCFCAGIHHTYHGKTGIGIRDQPGKLHLLRCAKAEADALLNNLLQMPAKQRMGMSQNHRSPGTDIIQIGVAIHIHDMGSIGMIRKQTIRMGAGKGAYR